MLPHGVNNSNADTQISLNGVSKKIDKPVGNYISNGANGVHLASDESILADEQNPTILVTKDKEIENSLKETKSAQRPPSPSTSTSTMSPSPRPKKAK